IDDAGIDVQAARFDYAHAFRSRQFRADADDFAVAHQQIAVFDDGARYGVDGGAAEQEGGVTGGRQSGTDKSCNPETQSSREKSAHCGLRSGFFSFAASFSWSSNCLRRASRAGRCSRSFSRSKYTSPSISTFSTLAKFESGCLSKITRSASFPISMEPTRLSMASCFAGLMVTSDSASVSFSPPYFMALAASVLRWRISSAESELSETTRPLRTMMAALYGMAS